VAVVEAEQLFTRAQAAQRLACSLDYIDKLIAQKRNGLWPVYHIAGGPRIPEKAIVRLLKTNRIN
jgi:hypothetical protein